MPVDSMPLLPRRQVPWTDDQRVRKYVEVPTSATAPQTSNHAVTIARLTLTRRACGRIPFHHHPGLSASNDITRRFAGI
jgi:hypothetical protein